jgi:hypothetical protein
MGIDHSIKHQKISRMSLEGTLHQSITFLEKKNGMNNRKEACLLIGISLFKSSCKSPLTSHGSWSMYVYV